MKVFCPTHGAHFPEEFDKTKECDFWEQRGMRGLPVEAKKMIWDWQFSFPFDEFAETYGVALDVSWVGTPYEKNNFEESVPNYTSLSESEQRELQKDWFKFMSHTSDPEKNKLLFESFIRQSKKWSEKLK